MSGTKRAPYIHKRLSIEELLKKPCKKGHDRSDAYVYTNPFDGKVTISCKSCRIFYYKPISKKNKIRQGRKLSKKRKEVQHELLK